MQDPLLALLPRSSRSALDRGAGGCDASLRVAREAIVARFRLPRCRRRGRSSLARRRLCRELLGVPWSPGRRRPERAKELDPPPRASGGLASRHALSYRVYRADFGVPGTAMALRDLSPPSAGTSPSRLPPRPRGPKPNDRRCSPLADLASRSDRELRDALEPRLTPIRGGLWSMRASRGAFAEPTLGEGLASTRRLVRESAAAFAAGREREADRRAIDAYLLGFEPLEPRLRARDPAATGNVEKAFADLRAAMARGDKGEARNRGARLEALLTNMGAGERGPSVPFWAAALIYFREGIEAALLVAALLAALRKLGRADASRFVHIGWVAALPAGVATWWVFRSLLSLGADRRELLESVVALLAAAVLFSVSFWMSPGRSQHWMGIMTRTWKAEPGRRTLLSSTVSHSWRSIAKPAEVISLRSPVPRSRNPGAKSGPRRAGVVRPGVAWHEAAIFRIPLVPSSPSREPCSGARNPRRRWGMTSSWQGLPLSAASPLHEVLEGIIRTSAAPAPAH